MVYAQEFYEMIADGAASSASVIVPLVLGSYPHIRTVVDVGCGEGWWGLEFERRGCEVLGLDLVAECRIPKQATDLSRPFRGIGWFDLVVCLEVGEHLPPRRARSFVRDLSALGPLVLWSAAIPGQGGIGHENERPPEFWAELWQQRGFRVLDDIRPRVRDDERVEWWYRQNVLTYEFAPTRPYVAPGLVDLKPDGWD